MNKEAIIDIENPKDNDLINRQAAIEAFSDMREGYPLTHDNPITDTMAVKILSSLPSVNPQESSITWVTGADRAKIAFKDVPVWKVTKICEILGEPQESEVNNGRKDNDI